MPTGRPYPAETRAGCVGEILAGEAIRAVARRYGIPYATVEAWWREDRPADSVQTRTRERLVDAIYDTADECLAAVRATARLVQDERWARKQEAAGLAVLVSALGDRSLRMLGGLRPVEADGQRAIPGPAAVVADVEPPADGPGE